MHRDLTIRQNVSRRRANGVWVFLWYILHRVVRGIRTEYSRTIMYRCTIVTVYDYVRLRTRVGRRPHVSAVPGGVEMCF